MRDSAALHNRVEDTEFRYMMDWRYSWQVFIQAVGRANGGARPWYVDGGADHRLPQGLGCDFEEFARFDTDPHSWIAHLIRNPIRLKLSLCPMWLPPSWDEPADERKSIDASLTRAGVTTDIADSARALRKPVLRLLDSAARVLPGDGFIAGQRVRFHLDQTEIGAARKAAADCRAQRWWCTALAAYVQFVAGEVSQASTTFDIARAAMPDSLRCNWDDASMFFGYGSAQPYGVLTCAQRDSVNERIWWLADPLYLENGNERRTEHYARHVLIELHAALDLDERFDWRPEYQGPALRDMVLRYGWPTEIFTAEPHPRRWHEGDTRSIFLGDTTTSFVLKGGSKWAIWCDGRNDDADCPAGHFLKTGTAYWGPQFHTVPLWQTVIDPFHTTDAGWDLAPVRDDQAYWDTSWWPTEFYRRDAGALVPLRSQVAFFRRQQSAVLAAAMSWDTVAYLAQPTSQMIGAAIFSTGPNAPLMGSRDTMSGRAPHALTALVASGPALLSLEMVPRASSGPAGRTRFGVDAPAPLRALDRGEIALSDIVLTSAKAGRTRPQAWSRCCRACWARRYWSIPSDWPSTGRCMVSRPATR